MCLFLTQHSTKRGTNLDLSVEDLDLHHGLGSRRLQLLLIVVTVLPVLFIVPRGQLVILKAILIT